MKLYNASLPADTLRGFTRRKTKTTTSTYSDVDLNASLNTYMDLFTTEILDSMDEWDFNGEIATTDIVAGQTEYIIPTDILKFKRLEVTLDSVKWNKAEAMDINEIGSATDETSRAQSFVTSEPFFDLMDNSLVLYNTPTVNVTGGIKIWYEKLQPYLSADTDEPNFARPFHKGLCYGAAKDYFEDYLEKDGFKDKMITATQNMQEVVTRMKAFYRRRNQDRQYIVGAAEVDYDFGNE